MAEMVSIWRWAITDDLEGLFAALIAADEAGFARIAGEISGSDPGERLEDMAAKTEAKMRAMGLPEEVLATMLKGLKTMQAEEADWVEASEGEGALDVALASSHMFYDDPYASLDYAEREAQVAVLFERYKAAIAKKAGLPGQSLVDAFGVTLEQFYHAEDAEVLMDTGLNAGTWVWAHDGVIYTLNQWQEDKELPIDLTFARMAAADFAALKAQVQAAH